MTVPRLDSLFHRPRPMRVVLQEFFVVIGLNHEGLHLAQSFHDHFGDVTKIGDESKSTRASVKSEPQRIDGIVGDGKRLHGDVADRKLGASRKNPPVTVLFDNVVAPNCFM